MGVRVKVPASGKASRVSPDKGTATELDPRPLRPAAGVAGVVVAGLVSPNGVTGPAQPLSVLGQ